MTLALKSPTVVSNIIAVDNAPIDAALLSSFAKYVEGMKKVESMGVKSLSEALEILKPYEEVRLSRATSRVGLRQLNCYSP